jgi:hypothetical protein
MITAEIAWRLRRRGLRLPPLGDYESLELRHIAIQQDKLMDEFDKLDREIQVMIPPQTGNKVI